MDPLSISASIVGLVQFSLDAISNLRQLRESDWVHLTKIQPHLGKFQTSVALLQIISKYLSTRPVLAGVQLSVQRCMERSRDVKNVLDQLQRDSRHKARLIVNIDNLVQRLSKEVDLFSDSVMTLWNFSQEAKMEHMLESIEMLNKRTELDLKYQIGITEGMNMAQQELLKHVTAIMDRLSEQGGVTQNVVPDDDKAPGRDKTPMAEFLSQLKAAMDTTRDNSDKRREDLNEIRSQLERTFNQEKTFGFSQSNEFVHTISILSQKDGVQDAASSTHCRATLDTGCHDNWVLTAIIERAGLLSSIERTTDPDTFQSFSGHAMEPQGQIELTFFLATASGSPQQTRTESFFVFDQLPVDLVLGKGFIARQFTLVSKHALGLVRHGKFTKEEIRDIETSLKEKGAANTEISSLRRAAGSSAREARRAEKAASRATTRGLNTPYTGTSGSSTPRHPASLRADDGSPGPMAPIDRLHTSSTQVSKASVSEDDDEAQEPEVDAGPSGTA